MKIYNFVKVIIRARARAAGVIDGRAAALHLPARGIGHHRVGEPQARDRL